MYKSVFIDLDNTVWAFDENSRDTFVEMYEKYHFNRYFDSFDQFFRIYSEKNVQLWVDYGAGRITKDEFNGIRYAYPFRVVGAYDEALINRYTKDYMSRIALKEKLMPHTVEALDYLYNRYNLYVLSNGFRELQVQKLRSSGVEKYFKRVILSEDIGVHKPDSQIYSFALSATQSELRTSIMIGDAWNTDIQGAINIGMDYVFFNLQNNVPPVRPMHEIHDWNEIKKLL